jgi:hypothetical protein
VFDFDEDWIEKAMDSALLAAYAGAAILMLVYLTSCATVTAQLEDTTFYKRDIELRINGEKAKGAVVVPRSAKYEIKGEVKGGFDFLIVRSCHREYTAEDEGGEFKYVYEPRDGIENNRACPLEIRGAEKGKGRNSFGFIDFEDPRYQLPARLECNGEVGDYLGVSVCQAPLGLIQKIKFQVPVNFEPGNEVCKLAESKDGKEFEFRMPAKQCQFFFMEKSEPHRLHRISTLGYEQTVIREF